MKRTTDEFGTGDINLKIVSRSIIETAKEELKQEEFREQVDNMKIKLREKKSFWSKIFPYKITIERRK